MSALANLAVLVAGIYAGAWQAGSIGRTVRGGSRQLGALGRLLSVAIVLCLSARAHHLAIAVAGWLAGLVGNGVVVYRRLR